jgi:hypothetical protein
VVRLRVVVLLVCLCSAAHAGVLYDGSISALPTTQGWSYLTDPFLGASATQTAGAGLVVLDSTPATSDSAGYFSHFPVIGSPHASLPTLDRTLGYTVTFRAQVLSESHSSTDRAGFSVIVLSDDVLGIELGFWAGEVWAQSGAGFTHAEGGAFDTTAAHTEYELAVLGSSYELSVGGSSVLTGALRDYSSHSHPVYSETNILFFGDDTSSAAAEIALSYVAVVEGAELGSTIPEPHWLCLVSIIALRRRRRERRGL